MVTVSDDTPKSGCPHLIKVVNDNPTERCHREVLCRCNIPTLIRSIIVKFYNSCKG